MERYKNKSVAVLMGGISEEREVSLVTGNAILKALISKGIDAFPIDVNKWFLKESHKYEIDLAFIALHGTYGEDGTIQGILEYMQIPYTGSGVLGSAIAYDKVITKELFKFNGIPTADYEVVYSEDRDSYKCSFDLPLVVKPSNQGSSIGVSIVKQSADFEPALDLAFKYSGEVIVEKFIEGKLLAIGMDGPTPLPIVHINPKSGFYDYESKYTPGKTEYICPAELSDHEKEQCETVSKKVFRVLKGRGVPRVDVILDDEGTPYVLEMNTIPGMTATSLLPMAARQSGIEFEDLVIRILDNATKDYK